MLVEWHVSGGGSAVMPAPTTRATVASGGGRNNDVPLSNKQDMPCDVLTTGTRKRWHSTPHHNGNAGQVRVGTPTSPPLGVTHASPPPLPPFGAVRHTSGTLNSLALSGLPVVPAEVVDEGHLLLEVHDHAGEGRDGGGRGTATATLLCALLLLLLPLLTAALHG